MGDQAIEDLKAEVREETFAEAADLMDVLWDECVKDRPKVNIYRAGMDKALRSAARELRERAFPIEVGRRVRVTTKPWEGEYGTIEHVDGAYNTVRLDRSEHPDDVQELYPCEITGIASGST